MPAPDYDRIAHLYEVDMARSMPFDDAGFFAAVCAGRAGRVLELGCGTGRILLPLILRGIDAVGIDCSAAMLSRLRDRAAAIATPPRLCRMDARALGFERSFATVLCPYSLVTYMTQPTDAQRLLAEARRVLLPGGLLAIDAFVPRQGIDDGAWRLDYRRPFRNGQLERSKRVTAAGAGVNRIERVYRVFSAAGGLEDEIRTEEHIRPFTPAELAAVVRGAGFTVVTESWDYGSAHGPDQAQFFAFTATSR